MKIRSIVGLIDGKRLITEKMNDLVDEIDMKYGHHLGRCSGPIITIKGYNKGLKKGNNDPFRNNFDNQNINII